MTLWKIRLVAFGLALVSAVAAIGGTIVLSVDGPDGHKYFDMGMLQEMPSVTIETETIWTDGEQVFTGVSLQELARHLGIEHGAFEAVATNAYSVEIPMTDAVEGGALIAYERNGLAMTVRDKGPLWIVYPYDHNPRYRSEETYSRSIWQLEKLIVKP